jgi:Leucine-rich repeat (LRR) protein
VNLLTIPDPVLLVTSLTSLDLSRNEGLQPASLSRLASLINLRELLLETCGLSSVPPQLGSLGRLEKLSLSYNKLQVLVSPSPTPFSFLPFLSFSTPVR